jgi:hypothetical protein
MPSNAQIDNVKEQRLAGSFGMVTGHVTIPTYETSGVNFILSNQLKDAGTPFFVMIQPASGYLFEHDRGSVSAGRIKAYVTNGNIVNSTDSDQPMVEVANATSLSVNTTFFAVGPQY